MQHLYARGEFSAWRQEALAHLDDLVDPTKIEQGRSLTLRETYTPDDIVYDMDVEMGILSKDGVSIKTTGSGIAVEGDSGEIRLDNAHEGGVPKPLEKRGWKFWKRKFWKKRPNVETPEAYEPDPMLSTREQLVDYVRTTVQQRRPERGRYTEVEMEEWEDTFEVGGVDDLDLGVPVDEPVDVFGIGEVPPEDVGIERPVDPFNYGSFPEDDDSKLPEVQPDEPGDVLEFKRVDLPGPGGRMARVSEGSIELEELEDQGPELGDGIRRPLNVNQGSIELQERSWGRSKMRRFPVTRCF